MSDSGSDDSAMAGSSDYEGDESSASLSGTDKGAKMAGRSAAAEAMDAANNVYFDYDSSDILDSQRTTLEAKAAWLKANPNAKLTIEGHCDERGTNEYNLALGERRATATRDYLVSLGVAASRIRIISYGEERPVCRESNESCWGQNRRSHFIVTGRGGA